MTIVLWILGGGLALVGAGALVIGFKIKDAFKNQGKTE